MHRRKFLHRSIRTALAIGAGIPSLMAAGQRRFTDDLPIGQDIKAIVAEIEKLIPGLLKEAKVKGRACGLVVSAYVMPA